MKIHKAIPHVCGLLLIVGVVGAQPQRPSLPGIGSPPGVLGIESDDEADGSTLARPTLLAERSALVVGEENWIGVTFAITEGWHLYWENPGDSGGPIIFQFETPDGVTIGEPRFPTPKRKLYAQDSVDYIYEREVAVLFPVLIDEGVSGTVRIGAEIDWLVCKDECLAGFAEVELTIPVTSDASGVEAIERPQFVRSRERLPRPVEDLGEAGLRYGWDGHTLRIEVADARRLIFYPAHSEKFVYPVGMAANGVASGGVISLAYNRYLDRAERVGGILEVHSENGVSYMALDVPTPYANSE